jgi:hypothetical protein
MDIYFLLVSEEKKTHTKMYLGKREGKGKKGGGGV